jgi:hypothetical protein
VPETLAGGLGGPLGVTAALDADQGPVPEDD